MSILYTSTDNIVYRSSDGTSWCPSTLQLLFTLFSNDKLIKSITQPIVLSSTATQLLLINGWHCLITLILHVDPVIARSTADREDHGLSWREFLWAKEMNLRCSTRPRCELIPLEGGVCVSVNSLTPYVGCIQNREWNNFPRETRTLM